MPLLKGRYWTILHSKTPNKSDDSSHVIDYTGEEFQNREYPFSIYFSFKQNMAAFMKMCILWVCLDIECSSKKRWARVSRCLYISAET